MNTAAWSDRTMSDAATLTDEKLIGELAALHQSRHELVRHGTTPSLQHTDRLRDLEAEYLSRFPDREVRPPAPRIPNPSRAR